MAPTVLVHHGTPLLSTITVGRRFEIVVSSLTDHIANTTFVTRHGQFRVQKVCSGYTAKL